MNQSPLKRIAIGAAQALTVSILVPLVWPYVARVRRRLQKWRNAA